MTDSSHLNFISTEDPNLLQKKYEAMSFEEMSKHMAESNRQMSELLTTSMSSSLSASTLDTIISVTEEPEEINEEEEEPHKKYTRLFTRAASNGDINKVKEMLSDEEIRCHIDINARDSDGTPPLIYAACFGKIEIAQILIDYGALVDTQDSCNVLRLYVLLSHKN